MGYLPSAPAPVYGKWIPASAISRRLDMEAGRPLKIGPYYKINRSILRSPIRCPRTLRVCGAFLKFPRYA